MIDCGLHLPLRAAGLVRLLAAVHPPHCVHCCCCRCLCYTLQDLRLNLRMMVLMWMRSRLMCCWSNLCWHSHSGIGPIAACVGGFKSAKELIK